MSSYGIVFLTRGQKEQLSNGSLGNNIIRL
nr:MAG TPA: hypothetical protein [Caudoviricetes sp.]